MTRILLWTLLGIITLFSFGIFSNVSSHVPAFSWTYSVFAGNDKQAALQADLTMSSINEINRSDIEWKNVKSFLSVITSYVLMASMFIAVTMFIYGSYQLFTSEWDPKKHSEAIKGMIYAGIAFLIISFSYTLVEVASRFQI